MPEASLTGSAPPSKRTVFFRRLLSFVVLWSLVLGAVFSGRKVVSDTVFFIFMVLLAGLGTAEFYGLALKRGRPCYRGWGVFGALLLVTSTFFYLSGAFGVQVAPAKANDFETSILIVFVLGLCLRHLAVQAGTSDIGAMATTLLGLMYVPWLLNFLQKINYFPGINGTGPFFLLYFILVTKFSDSGAYVVGSLIGKHKMVPRISPGKTWEGFGGALFGSLVGSLVFTWVAGERLPGMNALHAVVLGLILGGAAVVGDLIESLFKREAGVKDSGHFFPGIGGILDLVDSLLFNAPLMYLYLRHVLTN